jgi:hypothetical protein
MKTIHASLSAMLCSVLFASLALADPGTSWDKVITTGRFVVQTDFGNAAVLDRETGRLWERSPSTQSFIWFYALDHCYTLEVGGRKGWRLPTIEELASLVDTSRTNPSLPISHPFTNVQFSNPSASIFWSATTMAGFAGANPSAWDLVLFNGAVGNSPKSGAYHVWCVRGGQGVNGSMIDLGS